MSDTEYDNNDISFIELIEIAINNYKKSKNIDDFTIFTSSNFKNISVIPKLRFGRHSFLNKSIWVSQCDCYARIDIMIVKRRYRFFLSKTNGKGWVIDDLIDLNIPNHIYTHSIKKATAVINGGIKGIITFEAAGKYTLIHVHIEGLQKGKYAFHIHECGDLSNGCDSACAHFNPTYQLHGGIDDDERHIGDLGNLLANEKGIVKITLLDKLISLDMHHPHCIIGRAVVIHEQADDNRMGCQHDSHITGHAGKRIGCAVIGIAK